MILSHANRLPPRRGAILLVVMTLTALFAVIALSFALYSESAANSARINREAAAVNDDPPSAAAMANLFLGRLLYPSDPSGTNFGTTNDATIGSSALLNGIRGYDMATMVYGFNPNGGNTVPYNGIGTVFEDLTTNPTASAAGITDRRQVVNYSWQNGVGVFDPEHLGVRANATVGPTTTYVGRNAPYTYPDNNNLYVAVQDPTTGKILKVSFVSSRFGGLQSGNPNWTNPAGRFMTIRPRPGDHVFNGTQDFPFPPLDPDGIARGDVQNIPNKDGLQQNDAVWINAGLPVVQWRGKNIIPLVAPTILALDGRVNANVAGNTSQKSTNGFGPWEINLGRITTDAATMIQSRFAGGSTTPAPHGVTASPYNDFFPPSTATSTTSPPSSSLVDWNANATTPPYYPGATPPATDALGQADATNNPFKSNVWYKYTVASPLTPAEYGETGESSNNPAAFNPYGFNSFTQSAKLFSFPDLRRSTVKYSGRPSDYSAPYFGSTPPSTLTGTTPGNSSNQLRGLLTTTSNSLAKPGVMPNFRDYTSAGRTVQYAGGALVATATLPQDQILQAPFATPPAGSGSTNWVTDFSASSTATTIDQYRAAVASLGSVNLNRPLTDYRINPSAPLADPSNSPPPTNAAAFASAVLAAQQATIDRNQFAREIFARLIVATGAKAQVVNSTTIILPVQTAPNTYTLTTTGGTTVSVQQGEFDALHYLAQVAVNIVDYIDNDDVITAFVWNPIAPADPLNPANLQTTEVPNRVVYGVEKPRLVINEVYSEINNGPTNMGQPGPFHVNFYVELLNTSNNDVPSSPLAGPTTLGAPAGSVPLVLNSNSVYRFEIYQQGQTAVTDMAASPRGDTNPANPPVAQVDVATFTNTNPQLVQWVEPNNGAPVALATNRNGIAVFGPKQAGPTQPAIPNNTTLLTGGGGSATQAGTTPPQTDLFYTSRFARNPPTNAVRDNTVLLRRLMNPYLPPDATNNPYVTVDYMTHVYAEDGVETVQGPRPGTSQPHTNTQPNRRHSGGRVQPYTGVEAVNGGPNSRLAPYPTSLVVQQQTTHAATMPPRPLARTSLFQHNSQTDLTTGQSPANDSTLAKPFEWLVHLDRPLVNQMELLHVSGSHNHDLTHTFATPNAAGNPLFHQHIAFKQMLSSPTTMPPLYRALELLTVKPWGLGLPDGGRVPGKININMAWDHRVFEALLDAGAANSFQQTDVYNPTAPGDKSTTLWGKLIGTRTPNWDPNTNVPQPGTTVDEGGTDRPFKPLGTASFAAGGLLPSGSGLQDTLLRDVNPSSPTGTPAVLGFTNTSTTRTYQANEVPYQKTEMLRKMYNNITTTSDTYLVVMTVGFFEVRNAGPYSTSNPPVLGKEVFNEVPSDLRAKFVAVVDRSMIAADASNQQAVGPWYSEVAVSNPAPTLTATPTSAVVQFRATGVGPHPKDGSVNAIFVDYEGQRYYVIPNTPTTPATSPALADPYTTTVLRLGSGSGAVLATVTAVGFDINGNSTLDPNETFDASTGIATVVVSGLSSQPPKGTVVTPNATPGNPGFQANFDVTQPRYKGVVPFFDRVTIGQ